MTQDWQRLADYLAHILEATERIESYTSDVAEPAFLENQLVQDAVIRNLEVIGEASNNIAKRHPASPWHMVILKSTLKSFGRLFRTTFPDCILKFGRLEPVSRRRHRHRPTVVRARAVAPFELSRNCSPQIF